MAGKTYRDLVNDAKTRVKEVDPVELEAEIEDAESIVLIDCREGPEYLEGHLPGARHISRGVMEVRIHEAVPDRDANIVIYCGGGGRSCLTADVLQVMGYTQVRSLAGGFRGWEAEGFPVETE